MRRSTGHYNEAYFQRQSRNGEFAGRVNTATFQPHIRPQDTVIDFGCGGGYLLKNIVCSTRIGIEINTVAAETARAHGVTVYSATDDVPKDQADVVISNHALEHTRQPLIELGKLYERLRPGGRIVILVPAESILRRFRRPDLYHHLYTWSPMCLGNLLEEAGFQRVEASAYFHRAS